MIMQLIWTQNLSKSYEVDFWTIILPKYKGNLGLISIAFPNECTKVALKLII